MDQGLKELGSDGQSETQKRERLSTSKVENLIASVGNSESKAISLLVMKPDVIYSSDELQQALVLSQGDHPAWKMDHSAVWHYCSHSFEPIGLVAGEVVDDLSRRIGYVKTTFGKEVGDPQAALLLNYSLEHPDLSLYKLFGTTVSTSKGNEEEGTEPEYKKRAVHARLKTFRELSTAKSPIRVADLADKIGESPVALAQHLRNLDKYGVIGYEAIKYGERFTAYKLTDLGLTLIPPTLRQDIPNNRPLLFELLKKHRDQWLTRKDLADLVIESSKEQEGLVSDEKRLKIERQNGEATSQWIERGFIHVQDFHGDLRSRVSTTEKQRADLAELIGFLDQFQAQSDYVIQKGKEVALELTPDKISALMGKAKKNSPYSNRKLVDDFAIDLGAILTENPGLTSSDITKIVNERYDQQISEKGIRVRLNKLEKKGFVKRSSVRNNTAWSLTSTNSLVN